MSGTLVSVGHEVTPLTQATRRRKTRLKRRLSVILLVLSDLALCAREAAKT